MLLDPILGVGKNGHVLEIVIAYTNDEVDIGIGKCLEDIGICIIQLYPTDVEGSEEGGDTRRRGQVVRYLAIINPELEA